MRVLFYTDTPARGGAERQMALLARALSGKEVGVTVVCGAYSRIDRKAFAPYCEEVIELKTLHKHDPRHYGGLRGVLKSRRFDLIHIHLWNPGACRYAFFAAARAGVPVVATEHDPFELRGVKRLIKQACLKRTNHTIVISRENYGLMKECYGVPEEKLSVVPHGIDIAPFKSSQPAALGLPKDAPVITCVAELHPRKGHKYLLRAFEILRTTLPDAHLVLVGHGPLLPHLRDTCRERPNIHFLGWREDVPAILKASDVLVLPSLNEAFGLVLLEAMASGTAVIGTHAGGVPDIIQDGVNGLLVPPADSEALAAAIATFLRDPDKRRDLAQAAQARVRQTFTASRMAEATMRVYEDAQ